MEVLVTGAAGFVGSHLVERLLSDSNEVAVIDNLRTGSLNNIEGFKNNQKFNFVEGDIRDAKQVEGLVKRGEVLFHKRIKEMVGWVPKTSLNEALQIIIDDEKRKQSA